MLLIVYPEIKPKIHEIVLLGGSIGIGNMSPAAEFNILVFLFIYAISLIVISINLLGKKVDPEAAKVVFESSVRVVMVPLEVSHTALVTLPILERIQSFGSKFGEVMVDLLLFFKKTYLLKEITRREWRRDAIL